MIQYKEIKDAKVYQVVRLEGIVTGKTVLGTYSTRELAEYAQKFIHGPVVSVVGEVELVTGILEKPTYTAQRNGIDWLVRLSGEPCIVVHGYSFTAKDAESTALRIRDMMNKQLEETSGR